MSIEPNPGKLLGELDRRISLERDELVHRQGKVSHLVRLGRLEDARETCFEYIERFPEHLWPRLALLEVDCRRGEEQEARRRYETWATKVGSFWTFESYFRWLGRKDKEEEAIPWLRQASKAASVGETPSGVYFKVPAFPANDPEEAHDIIFNDAKYAYRIGDFQLALSLMEIGRSVMPARADWFREWNLKLMESGSLLALGGFAEAMEVARSVERMVAQGNWENEELESLRALINAIEARNTKYRLKGVGAYFPRLNFLAVQVLVRYD